MKEGSMNKVTFYDQDPRPRRTLALKSMSSAGTDHAPRGG
jgi:hypothetical protein